MGPFTAKLGTDVVELLQLAGLAQLVLDVGAYHPGGILRTQGQRLSRFGLASRIFSGLGRRSEGIHFLGNDVSFLSHPAGEELCVLKNGRADFTEGIALENAPRRGLDVVPKFGFRWQQVPGAPDSLQNAHKC